MPEPDRTNRIPKHTHRKAAAQAAVLSLLLLIVGGAVFAAEWLCYRAGRQEYSRLADMYVETKAAPSREASMPPPANGRFPPSFSPSSPAPAPPSGHIPSPPGFSQAFLPAQPAQSRISSVDFASLQAGNPDCVAWIEIPGAPVSYPVMYRAGDSRFYLTHSYGLTESKAGAIHIDGASEGTGSRNLLIYGHTLLDGSMFTALHRYKSQAFYQAHPYIYLYLPDGTTRRYQIAACILTEGEQERFYLWDFQDAASAQAYYDQFMERSLYPTGVWPRAEDGLQTLVLSTCARRIWRRLIFAVEV